MAANICVAIAQWYPFTTVISVSFNGISCWRIFGSRSTRARSISPSVILTFSMEVGMQSNIVKALHEEFSDITYDVTIKIEHLLKFVDRLPIVARYRLRFCHDRGRSPWTIVCSKS